MKFKILTLLLMSFLICLPQTFAMAGDGGTVAACYPGGFNQVLLGIKPFIMPCAQFTPLSLCYRKGRPYAALAMFWVPTYAIEVTGQAGTTVLPSSLGDIVTGSVVGGGVSGGSMVQGEGASGSPMTKYRETHVYELSRGDVAKILTGHHAMTCMIRSAMSSNGRMIFKTESNHSWRMGNDPAGGLSSFNPTGSSVGSWGPLYPRTGWSQHPSNVTNSLLLAYRAQHLASEFYPVKRGAIFTDKYEIGGPIPGTCYPIGTPSMAQEKGANRPGCADRFVIIFWRLVVTCCNFGTF